jgi:hypothetical protein
MCVTKMEPTDAGRPGVVGGIVVVWVCVPDRSVSFPTGLDIARPTQPGRRSVPEPGQGREHVCDGGRRGRGAARDLDGAGGDGCSARPGAAGASSARIDASSTGRGPDSISLRSTIGRRPSREPAGADRGPHRPRIASRARRPTGTGVATSSGRAGPPRCTAAGTSTPAASSPQAVRPRPRIPTAVAADVAARLPGIGPNQLTTAPAEPSSGYRNRQRVLEALLAMTVVAGDDGDGRARCCRRATLCR